MKNKPTRFFAALTIGVLVGVSLFLLTKMTLFFILGPAFGLVANMLLPKEE